MADNKKPHSSRNFNLEKDPEEVMTGAAEAAPEPTPTPPSKATQKIENPVPEPVEMTRTQRSWVKWLLIILVCALVAICLLFFLGKKSFSANGENENSLPPVENTDTTATEPTADPAADESTPEAAAPTAEEPTPEAAQPSADESTPEATPAVAPETPAAKPAAPKSQPAAPEITPAADSDFESAVRAAIAGKYGNGRARRQALGDRYHDVQTEINRRLRH